MKIKEQDLTNGSVYKNLIKFAVPLLAANLLQSFYSIADMLVVGRIVGKVGLAVTMLVVVFVQLFAEPIIRLFDPSGTDVISIGILYLRICCSANSLIYAAMYLL